MIGWKQCQINIWYIINQKRKASTCWLRHITLTSWNIRPHLIRNGQRAQIYIKSSTLFMDFAHCVYLWNVYLFIFRIHYLFIFVFLLFPEVQKCYVFWHCAILFVYLCISFIPEVQKCYVFRHCVYCKKGSSHITMSLANTNTVNKHFFDSSVTHRSTSRYLVNQIFWQWIE